MHGIYPRLPHAYVFRPGILALMSFGLLGLRASNDIDEGEASKAAFPRAFCLQFRDPIS